VSAISLKRLERMGRSFREVPSIDMTKLHIPECTFLSRIEWPFQKFNGPFCCRVFVSWATASASVRVCWTIHKLKMLLRLRLVHSWLVRLSGTENCRPSAYLFGTHNNNSFYSRIENWLESALSKCNCNITCRTQEKRKKRRKNYTHRFENGQSQCSIIYNVCLY